MTADTMGSFEVLHVRLQKHLVDINQTLDHRMAQESEVELFQILTVEQQRSELFESERK